MHFNIRHSHIIKALDQCGFDLDDIHTIGSLQRTFEWYVTLKDFRSYDDLIERGSLVLEEETLAGTVSPAAPAPAAVTPKATDTEFTGSTDNDKVDSEPVLKTSQEKPDGGRCLGGEARQDTPHRPQEG